MPDAKPFEHVALSTLKEIAQSLMTMKSQCTSLENSATAFMPLTDHAQAVDALANIADGANKVGQNVILLYRAIAREAAQA